MKGAAGAVRKANSIVSPKEAEMLILVVVLLAIWLIVSIVGFALEGLMWIGVVGIVLFLATGVIGFARRKALHRPSPR